MGNETYNNPTSHLIDYLASQGVMMQEDPFIPKGSEVKEASDDTNINEMNGEVVVSESETSTLISENVSEDKIITEEVNTVTPTVQPVNTVEVTAVGNDLEMVEI